MSAKTTLPRVALSFVLGCVVWTLYRTAWGAWRYFNAFADEAGYDLWGVAPEVLGIIAITAIVELALCIAVAALLWVMLGRLPRGVVLAAALAAIVFYLMNVVAFLMLPAGLRLEGGGITWQSLVPGPQTAAHIVAAALVGALIWRIAYAPARVHDARTA